MRFDPKPFVPWIRAAAPYIHALRGKTIVIAFGGEVVADETFLGVVHDLNLLHSLGTRLVVVMGHSQCGAITATLEELAGQATSQSRNLRSIVDRVRPSVESVIAVGGQLDPATLIHEAVRANVRASANHLRHGSEILERLIRDGGLQVVGAEYSLETGTVDFFDGV